MDDMNPILAGIYGTGGQEKVASADGQFSIETLNDLALAIAAESSDDGDIEKVASAGNEIFEHLVDFDQAGRSIAQLEYSAMEKAASEGDPSALLEFHGIEQEMTPSQATKAAISAELQRRLS